MLNISFMNKPKRRNTLKKTKYMYECSVGKFLAPTTSMKILSPFNLHNVLLVENSCLLNSGSIRTPTFSPIRTRPHPSLLDTNPGSAPHVLVYICFIEITLIHWLFQIATVLSQYILRRYGMERGK